MSLRLISIRLRTKNRCSTYRDDIPNTARHALMLGADNRIWPDIDDVGAVLACNDLPAVH